MMEIYCVLLLYVITVGSCSQRNHITTVKPCSYNTIGTFCMQQNHLKRKWGLCCCVARTHRSMFQWFIFTNNNIPQMDCLCVLNIIGILCIFSIQMHNKQTRIETQIGICMFSNMEHLSNKYTDFAYFVSTKPRIETLTILLDVNAK